MRVYIVQHGEAVSKDMDPDRPLSESGRTDIDRLARFLRPLRLPVSRVVHSGKTRARQTAELLSHGAALGIEPSESAGLGPNDPVEPFVDVLRDHPEDTLLVGHMPFVGRLVTQLIVGHAEHELVAFQPGSLTCVEFDTEKHWRIAWMTRPDLLAQ